MVIEDDIDFLYNKEYVYYALNKALRNNTCDIMYLGINPSDRCNNDIKTTDIVGDTFKIDQHIWGTFAIVYQNKGLDIFDNIPDDIDNFTANDREDMVLIKSDMNKVCIYPPIISVGDFETTTGTGLQTCGKYVKKKSDIAIIRSLYRLGLVDEKYLEK